MQSEVFLQWDKNGRFLAMLAQHDKPFTIIPTVRVLDGSMISYQEGIMVEFSTYYTTLHTSVLQSDFNPFILLHQRRCCWQLPPFLTARFLDLMVSIWHFLRHTDFLVPKTGVFVHSVPNCWLFTPSIFEKTTIYWFIKVLKTQRAAPSTSS